MQHVAIENFYNVVDRQTVDCSKCPALARIGVIEVGITHATVGWHFQRVSSDHAFLAVSIGGMGEVAVGNRWLKAGPETAYLMPPHVFHGYRVAPGAEWRYVWVRFTDASRYSNLFAPSKTRLVEVAGYSVLAAVEGIIRESNHTGNPQLLVLWSELLLHSLLQLTFPLKPDSRLEELWAIVGRQLDRNWSIETLAGSAHMSREQLRRLCLQYYGCTPHRKLTSLRLHRACEMLLQENAKLEVISKELAYSDAFAFSQAFKRKMGVAPQTYRKLACKARSSSKTDMI
jgi:AraC-like DNA-binding protein